MPVEQITKKRLDDWAKKFTESHATPVLALGVGHDYNSGQLVLCIVDDTGVTPETLLELVLKAMSELQK